LLIDEHLASGWSGVVSGVLNEVNAFSEIAYFVWAGLVTDCDPICKFEVFIAFVLMNVRVGVPLGEEVGSTVLVSQEGRAVAVFDTGESAHGPPRLADDIFNK
jgi:hypothetical protein